MDATTAAASLLAAARDTLWRTCWGQRHDERTVRAAELAEEARLLLLPPAQAEAESDGVDVREQPPLY